MGSDTTMKEFYFRDSQLFDCPILNLNVYFSRLDLNSVWLDAFRVRIMTADKR